ncbi:MAG: hypothetical protein KDB72_10955 [Mycobacterium sp.]|nr:hypothetical protein [Mycobacterium sp.]
MGPQTAITGAISNTAQHSGARTLTIEVGAGDELLVEITDDGTAHPLTTGGVADWQTCRTAP